MKAIKAFCEENELDYKLIKSKWPTYLKECK